MNKKEHWEKVYSTKAYTDVSWYQPDAITTLELLDNLNLDKNAAILDVGSGDSHLVDHLLNLGFTNISVLDISGKALKRAKKRLGGRAELVTWIEADIAEFNPTIKYDLWHDRAVFHFLTQPKQIAHYRKIVSQNVNTKGYFLLATFSDYGPLKCSGLEVARYSLQEQANFFSPEFVVDKQFNINHTTPSGGVQNFSFSLLIKQ